MTNNDNKLVILPTQQKNIFQHNEDGLFKASTLAREYGKDVYGYTRGQKVKELVKELAQEHNLDPEHEFSEIGNIVRITTEGLNPGTWMHFDLFIKFLGWLDTKLEREFMKTILAVQNKPGIDPLQEELARVEAEATSFRRKLAHVPFYKDLQKAEKRIKQLNREIEKESKTKRKDIVEGINKDVLLLGNGKQ